MSVRAKFRYNSHTTELHRTYPHRKAKIEGGTIMERDLDRLEETEKRTLNFTPVGDDSPENKLFWDATPSGSLQMGTLNPEAWKEFELGEEYYLDFTPVKQG